MPELGGGFEWKPSIQEQAEQQAGAQKTQARGVLINRSHFLQLLCGDFNTEYCT